MRHVRATAVRARAIRKHRLFRLILTHIMTAVTLLAGCVPNGFNGATQGTPGSAWELLAPGLERRVYRTTLTQFVILRIDPNQYLFRVHYRPGAPLDIDQWNDALPGAVAFVNGNYFDKENHALGLVVADGVVYGNAYQNMGGMLVVQDGIVRVRSTVAEPYTGEPLDQAVQAFPMLIADGKAAFSNPQGDRVARRTVVGQDKAGRILLMATSALAGMKLVDLSNYLAASDLDLVNAFNLDGGSSTLLSLNVPGQPPYQIASVDPVPTVLAVYPRSG